MILSSDIYNMHVKKFAILSSKTNQRRIYSKRIIRDRCMEYFWAWWHFYCRLRFSRFYCQYLRKGVYSEMARIKNKRNILAQLVQKENLISRRSTFKRIETLEIDLARETVVGSGGTGFCDLRPTIRTLSCRLCVFHFSCRIRPCRVRSLFPWQVTYSFWFNTSLSNSILTLFIYMSM